MPTNLGDELTRNTIRLALLFYLAAVVLRLTSLPRHWAPESSRWRLIRGLWTLACLIYVIHVGLAFHFFHHWSHSHAVEHTRQVSGVGEGIYVSHLFTLLWLADVIFWWVNPTKYANRSPWIDRCLHGFMLFVIFNGTVIFEAGVVRWVSLVCFAGLALLLLMRDRK